MPARKPKSNLPLAIRYTPSNAVAPPLGKLSEIPISERVKARYGALKLGIAVACAAAVVERPTLIANRSTPPGNRRMPNLQGLVGGGYPTDSAAFRDTGTPRHVQRA